jgi:hypothetical protein
MITGVTISNVGTTAKFSMWLEQKTGASLDGILKVNFECTAKFSVVYSPRNENLNLLVKSLNLFLCSSYKKLKNFVFCSSHIENLAVVPTLDMVTPVIMLTNISWASCTLD